MFLCGILCGMLAVGQSEQLRTVKVDAGRVVGTIRSLQGVNCGPLGIVPQLPDVSKQYRDLRIDLIRAHDFFGPTDIDARWPNPDPIARSVRADAAKTIFPRWEADPEQESSYNFGPSDKVIKAMVDCGAGVLYRIGRSWSADPAPPADFDRFAAVAKHVVLHYNHGWAKGFHYNIHYWDFWNEPDTRESWGPGVRAFWSGTPEQFFKLYEKTARALKACDPAIKIGAPGQAAGGHKEPYREGLIAYCAQHNVPLDFFSWHLYTSDTADPYDLPRVGTRVRALLDDAGFRAAENIVDEWNLSAAAIIQRLEQRNKMQNAVFLAAALTYMQDSPIDRSTMYRGDATMAGLFNYDGSYRKTAYAMKAHGAMLDTPQRLPATGGDTFGFAVLAGQSADKNCVQVLISNYEIPEEFRNKPARRGAGGLPPQTNVAYRDNRGYHLEIEHLPWGEGKFSVTRRRITTGDDWAEIRSTGEGDRLEISNPLPPPAVELIVLRKQ